MRIPVRIEGDAERSSYTPAPKLDVILVQSIKVDGNFSSRILPSCGNHACLCMFVYACACMGVSYFAMAACVRSINPNIAPIRYECNVRMYETRSNISKA